MAETDLVVITWMWGDKYGPEYFLRLERAVRKHLQQPHRFFLMTERERETPWLPKNVERHAIKDPELTKEKGCFARLRMFDHGWQKNRRIAGRVVCLDLDCIITAALDDLFYRQGDFNILQGVNASNPCPYNGSLLMFRANTNGHVWYDFSLEHARRLPYYEFPDDQGWYWQKVPDAGAYGPNDGVYAFTKPGWPEGTHDLPLNAKMVVFPGSRDPNKVTHLPWVKKHWLGEADVN